MFVLRKKYNELLEQKKDYERIANNAIAQNGRLLDQWQETIEKIKDFQALNYIIVDRNEELTARVKELEAKLALVTKQRDELEEECKCLEMDLLDAEMTIAAMEREQEEQE